MTESPCDLPRADRVASVDALRGMTILLMVFVNDLGRAAPAWMHHIQPSNADGMTLADVVFPAFLFIVGLSIPLAFQRARQRGATTRSLLGHVLLRSLALLTMGLIEFNRQDAIVLGPLRWGLLAYVAIILAWCVVPPKPGKPRQVLWVVKLVGIAGLITLLAVYRRTPVNTQLLWYGEVKDWAWLRTGWWGILGLIGWAYLTVALLYLAIGRRREWLMGALALLILLYLAMDQGGLFTRVADKTWLTGLQPALSFVQSAVDQVNRYVSIGSSLGSLAAITMAGCLLGSILIEDGGLPSARERIRWSLGFAGGLFVAGLVTDTFAGINKIGATPTWCLWCAALTCLAWTLLYLVMDIWGWTRWSIIVRPAGANPLIAYLLHPLLIWTAVLLGVEHVVRSYAGSTNWLIVVGGSALTALLICGLTGAIARAGIRLHL